MPSFISLKWEFTTTGARVIIAVFYFKIAEKLSKMKEKYFTHFIFETKINQSNKIKGKVFYGQEPPSGESTTTGSGVDYQLLSVMH